jgi:hypothetical protein
VEGDVIDSWHEVLLNGDKCGGLLPLFGLRGGLHQWLHAVQKAACNYSPHHLQAHVCTPLLPHFPSGQQT